MQEFLLWLGWAGVSLMNYLTYIKNFVKKYGFKEMKETQFKYNCVRVIKERGFKITREKDTEHENKVCDFIHFDELDSSKK